MKGTGARLLLLLGILLAVTGCGELARLWPGTAAVKVVPQEGVEKLRVRVYDAAKTGVHAVFEAAPGVAFGVNLDGLSGEAAVEISGETREGFPLHRWEGQVRASSTLRYVEFNAETRLMASLSLIFVHVPTGTAGGTLYVYAYPVSGAATVAGPELGGAEPVALRLVPVSEGGSEQVEVPVSPAYAVVLEDGAGSTYTWTFAGASSWMDGDGVVALDFDQAEVK